LAGVIDTDGHYAVSGYNLIFKSERLLDDIIFVARSLGFAAYKQSTRKEFVNNGVWGTYWRCSINGPVHEIPCRVPRKKAVPRTQKKNPLRTGIRVEPIGYGDYFGFTIDGDHLFMLGDFTVTHNTHLLRVLTLLYPKDTIIFTVPSRDVAREIHKGLVGYDAKIGFVGDGTVNPQRVTVAVTHSLKHCNKNANLLVADEAHALVSERFREDLVQFPRAKFIAMTASPTGRSDGGDQYIEALFGPVIAEVPYQEAVDSGNVVPLDVWIFPVTTGPNVQSIERKDLKDRAGIWANQYRNETIRYAVQYAAHRLNDPDLQVLIMVDKTEHAFRLQQLLPDFTVVTGEKDAEDYGDFLKRGVMVAGQKPCTKKDRDRYKEEFSAGRLKKVIATFVWSKGVNFLDLNVLVRADGTSSPILSTQVPGRLSRLGTEGNKGKGILIDFNDTFSPDLQGRSRTRFRVYRQHGFKIETIS
jgi:superfamily II DNA or RNA helicase